MMRHFLKTALLTVISVAIMPEVSMAQQKPNVIILFMDDMGYGDLSCYGTAAYTTPNMDALAAAGTRFTHFYAAQAVCSASRAGLLTGCYPNRIGISGALFPSSTIALNPEEETIAEVVKKAGYKTGMVGKWHLGQKPGFFPMDHGFDEFFGLPYSNDMWPVGYDGQKVTDTVHRKANYPPLPLIDGARPARYIENLEDQGQLTPWYTERAVKFIEKHKKEPFLLYLAYSMPHVPIYASPKFLGKSGQGLYADMMLELDWSLGEIRKTLKAQGIADNTVIILTSDNGPWLNFGNHAGNSGGLREGKGTAWEGGVRVPAIMAWPGKIPAGRVANGIASTIDILPTVAALAGAPLPGRKIDGVNLWPYLSGKTDSSPRQSFAYYYDRNNLKCFRQGDWKLVFPSRSQTYLRNPPGMNGWPGRYADTSVPKALYNLRMDPGETRDMQHIFPDVVKQLEAAAEQYRVELGDDLTKRQGTEIRPAAAVKL